MSDTITFSGLTAYLSPGFREPRRCRRRLADAVGQLQLRQLRAAGPDRQRQHRRAGGRLAQVRVIDDRSAAHA